jgi:hypothetical protein
LYDIYDIYYNNRDLKLLLDLLATSSVVAPAISIIILLDKVISSPSFVGEELNEVTKTGSSERICKVKHFGKN